MTNAQYLDAYFNSFPGYFGMTWISYREYFKQLITHNTMNRVGVANALLSTDVNWKERAYWSDFFLYDEFKTEEDIKIDYMLLTWDVLFPKEILCFEQLDQLKIKTIEILKKIRKCNGSESVHIDDVIWQLEEEDFTTLSRFDLLYMQREVGH